MLCLSRGEGESIRIGENVIVTINRVKGRKVSVGIQAPSSVEIVRTEIERDDTDLYDDGGPTL
jgi:carbon storage regulator